MEHCSGGDLFTLVLDQELPSEEKVAKIMYKLISGVNHMHSKNVMHRDLKPENILLSNKDSKN